MTLEKIKTDQVDKAIENLLKEVRTKMPHLEEIPFFIAGGIVFDIIQKNKISSNIDIFFYNESHLHAASALIVVDEYNSNISLMAGNFDTPQSAFDTFDLNCSKCAITDKGDLILDKTFSTDIEFDLNNITLNTFNRYIIYVYIKNAKDDKLAKLDAFVDHVIVNWNEEIKSFNELSSSINSHKHADILPYMSGTVEKDHFPTKLNQNNAVAQELHNRINKLIPAKERLTLFTSIKNIRRDPNFYGPDLDISPEAKIGNMLHVQKAFAPFSISPAAIGNETYGPAMEMYPEYFI